MDQLTEAVRSKVVSQLAEEIQRVTGTSRGITACVHRLENEAFDTSENINDYFQKCSTSALQLKQQLLGVQAGPTVSETAQASLGPHNASQQRRGARSQSPLLGQASGHSAMRGPQGALAAGRPSLLQLPEFEGLEPGHNNLGGQHAANDEDDAISPSSFAPEPSLMGAPSPQGDAPRHLRSADMNNMRSADQPPLAVAPPAGEPVAARRPGQMRLRSSDQQPSGHHGSVTAQVQMSLDGSSARAATGASPAPSASFGFWGPGGAAPGVSNPQGAAPMHATGRSNRVTQNLLSSENRELLMNMHRQGVEGGPGPGGVGQQRSCPSTLTSIGNAQQAGLQQLGAAGGLMEQVGAALDLVNLEMVSPTGTTPTFGIGPLSSDTASLQGEVSGKQADLRDTAGTGGAGAGAGPGQGAGQGAAGGGQRGGAPEATPMERDDEVEIIPRSIMESNPGADPMALLHKVYPSLISPLGQATELPRGARAAVFELPPDAVPAVVPGRQQRPKSGSSATAAIPPPQPPAPAAPAAAPAGPSSASRFRNFSMPARLAIPSEDSGFPEAPSQPQVNAAGPPQLPPPQPPPSQQPPSAGRVSATAADLNRLQSAIMQKVGSGRNSSASQTPGSTASQQQQQQQPQGKAGLWSGVPLQDMTDWAAAVEPEMQGLGGAGGGGGSSGSMLGQQTSGPLAGSSVPTLQHQHSCGPVLQGMQDAAAGTAYQGVPPALQRPGSMDTAASRMMLQQAAMQQGSSFGHRSGPLPRLQLDINALSSPNQPGPLSTGRASFASQPSPAGGLSPHLPSSGQPSPHLPGSHQPSPHQQQPAQHQTMGPPLSRSSMSRSLRRSSSLRHSTGRMGQEQRWSGQPQQQQQQAAGASLHASAGAPLWTPGSAMQPPAGAGGPSAGGAGAGGGGPDLRRSLPSRLNSMPVGGGGERMLPPPLQVPAGYGAEPGQHSGSLPTPSSVAPPLSAGQARTGPQHNPVFFSPRAPQSMAMAQTGPFMQQQQQHQMPHSYSLPRRWSMSSGGTESLYSSLDGTLFSPHTPLETIHSPMGDQAGQQPPAPWNTMQTEEATDAGLAGMQGLNLTPSSSTWPRGSAAQPPQPPPPQPPPPQHQHQQQQQGGGQLGHASSPPFILPSPTGQLLNQIGQEDDSMAGVEGPGRDGASPGLPLTPHGLGGSFLDSVEDALMLGVDDNLPIEAYLS